LKSKRFLILAHPLFFAYPSFFAHPSTPLREQQIQCSGTTGYRALNLRCSEQRTRCRNSVFEKTKGLMRLKSAMDFPQFEKTDFQVLFEGLQISNGNLLI